MPSEEAPDLSLPLDGAYAVIVRWYRERLSTLLTSDQSTDAAEAASLEYRQRSRELIERLPDTASNAEMRAVLHEVRSGLLEWGYVESNGPWTNGEIANRVLESSGGTTLTEAEVRELLASPLWSYLTVAPRFAKTDVPQDSPPSESSPASARENDDPAAPAPPKQSLAVRLDPEAFDLSAGATAIMKHAESRARRYRKGSRVTSTTFVLLAMAQLGRAVDDPQWIGEFVRYHLRVSDEQLDELEAAYVDRRPAWLMPEGNPQLAVVTPGLVTVLETAKTIALRATGKPTIAGRHLFGALLLAKPSQDKLGAVALLERLGQDLPLIRQRLYEWVRGYEDDDAVWRDSLLGTATAPARLATFHTDDPQGPDLLGIDQDVVALATLISACAVTPPLSIGLFGDWGSGKTFFMRQLRRAVTELSKKANEARGMQRDQPFYKHIVQIDFNAWHYVDGNLWASLVEHIFDNLRHVDERSTVRAMQEHWIDKLKFADTARTEAVRRETAAQQRVAAAEESVRSAKADHEKKQQELQELSIQNVKRDFMLSGAHTVVVNALAPLGLEPLTQSANDLQASLSEARAVLGHGTGVLASLVHARDRSARFRGLLLILAGAPVAGLLVAEGLRWLGVEKMSQVSGLATGAAGLLSFGAAWIRRQAQWVSERTRQLEDAQRKYDAELAKEQAATESQMVRARQELDLARQDYAAAQREAAQARRDHESAAAGLQDTTAARVLARFIDDRAASADYRKHLGVVALVRDDFEQLSELIEEENWRLSRAAPDDTRFRHVTKFETPAEEEAQATMRINRIVLYIDDLDRCPPNKVVDVLQAVHLLLAFPLFVVVVGVDARWIRRSLETKYRELLHAGPDGGAANMAQMFGVAGSGDYLEKIFQVPLWLRPMGADSARRMVQGLVRPPGSAVKSVSAPNAPQPDQAPAPPAPDPQSGPRVQAQTDSPDKGGTAGRGDASGLGEPALRAAGPATTTSIPNVEALEVGDLELAAITNLAPLLGRSPRALKRYVNVYRLIKAGMTPSEHAVFIRRREDTISDFEAVLFLLAVDTGLPRISSAFFAELRTTPREGELTVDVLIARLMKPDLATDSRRLVRWLESRKADPWLAKGVTQLVRWAPNVARYSFEAAT